MARRSRRPGVGATNLQPMSHRESGRHRQREGATSKEAYSIQSTDVVVSARQHTAYPHREAFPAHPPSGETAKKKPTPKQQKRGGGNLPRCKKPLSLPVSLIKMLLHQNTSSIPSSYVTKAKNDTHLDTVYTPKGRKEQPVKINSCRLMPSTTRPGHYGALRHAATTTGLLPRQVLGHDRRLSGRRGNGCRERRLRNRRLCRDDAGQDHHKVMSRAAEASLGRSRYHTAKAQIVLVGAIGAFEPRPSRDGILAVVAVPDDALGRGSVLRRLDVQPL